MQKNKKSKYRKAQTSVIVTVLLILIGILAAGFLGYWITKMIKDNISEQNIHVDLSIDRQYSFYNPSVINSMNYGCVSGCVNESGIYLKINRGSGSAELSGIRFIFEVGSGSLSYMNPNVPGELESKTYYFPLYEGNTPTKVKIAPIAKINGKEKVLDIVDEFTLRTLDDVIPLDKLERCSVLLSADANPSVPNICGNS